MKQLIILFIIISNIYQPVFSQSKQRTDANINGHVVCKGEHIPFATVSIKGTSIGTSTDETGHYQIINLPEGTHIISARSLGYKPKDMEISIKAGETKEVNFELVLDVLGLQEVVVTGSRNATNRKESSMIVNTITSMQFTRTQSINLSEGLNFCPGIRTENNCQNCGFSQVRMNGMEGPYSQILINGRPIFSGLAGVYGLELIPTAMIERVEVIRGSGSVLYGNNAIAGTINLILKDPVNNSYEFGINSGLTGVGMVGSGDAAPDLSINFNTSLVSNNSKTGMSLYGFYRNREFFDANNDSFSEIASLNNTTIGTRLFHRFGKRNKLAFDFFNIKEKRRGGDKFDHPVHETGIAEAIEHNLLTAALTYKQYLREDDLFTVFVSGQKLNRNSYYGANQSLSDYGKTKDFIYAAGLQYDTKFGLSKLVFGIENQGEWLEDIKLGYPDIDNAVIINDSIVEIPHKDNTVVANQTSNTIGVFSQYEVSWEKLKLSAGLRFNNYRVEDKELDGSTKTGNVLNPAVNIMYDIRQYLQARLSYSQGYRAPQIFDEDLHIETSGSRQVIHKNAPDLKQESSHSITASMDFNKQIGKVNFGLLLEAFYTKLNDPFANEYSEANDEGVVVYTRINAEKGAVVQGVNIELNFIPNYKFSVKSGFTIQSNRYKEAQEFDEKHFFRTPREYGYLTLDWKPIKSLGFSSTSTYTGKMLIPYFGMQISNPEAGELRTSKTFFDLGAKIRYYIKLNGARLQLFAGIKNIFNSYQDDFDRGIDRDPGYVYGPALPRTFYFGVKIGNSLN